MQKTKNEAFTLVELIVVITILAILGTIAFISLQGYSKTSRDAARISDISIMKTSLEVFQLDAGKYPIPTSGTDITYSGTTVWTQGTFGDSVYNNLTKLDKIPIDPLSDSYYTYSVTSTRKQYEIGGITETDELTFSNNKANAGDIEAFALVKGNYNGLMTKTVSGSTCNIISIPTIIANDIETSSDLINISINKKFVKNGYKNLPSSFSNSKFKIDGGFDFEPNSLVAYSGTCDSLVDKTDYSARIEMINGLKNAYNGTIIKNDGEIKNLIELVIDTNNPSSNVINFAGNFVNNNLGGNISIGGNTNVGINWSCNTNQPNNTITLTEGSPISSNQSWQSSNPNDACYFRCNNGYGSTGTGCISAPECIEGLTEITLNNGQTWSCTNLGATLVRNGTDTFSCLSSTDCSNKPDWAGDYYQWGRNDTGHTSGDYSTNYDWSWPQDNNLWGDSTDSPVGTNFQARKGPCPGGWHVPSSSELMSMCNSVLSPTSCSNGMPYNSLISSVLKIPKAGNRSEIGTYENYGAILWSSTPNGTSAYELYYDSPGQIYPNGNNNRAKAMSVRCIKD